jgi:hypothetical protein
MSERVIDISFPVKESILLSLKEDKREFAKELLFLGALVLYRKKGCPSARLLNWRVTTSSISSAGYKQKANPSSTIPTMRLMKYSKTPKSRVQ